MSTVTAPKKKREAERRERHGNATLKNHDYQNVGDTERVISSILGGTLLIGGLTRRSLPGLVFAATGAALLYRGATGHCTLYESLGMDTHRETLNFQRSADQPNEATQHGESIEEKQSSSKTRSRQKAQGMTGKKHVGKATAVPSLSKK